MSLSFSIFRKDEEFAEQRALFSAAFPENEGLPPATEAFYLRKFRAFPANPQAYEYTARDSEGMVGYYAAIPFSYRVEGEDLKCGMVCDVMTAPRMQGKGVFTKLGAYSLESLTQQGIDFVTGYPRRAAVIPGHLKVGWEIYFRLPLYLMPLRANALLAARGAGVLAPIANLLIMGARGLLRLLRPSGRGLEIRERDWKAFLAEEDYQGFLDRWRAGRRNSLNKNEEFLNWRLAFQGVDYRVVSAHLDGGLVGVSILRHCRPEGIPSLALMDVMALGPEGKVLAALANGWYHLADRDGAQVILTMMSEHLARKRQLWRLGFMRSPTVFSLIVKCLSARAKKMVHPDPGHWDLMWIDCDDL